MKQGRAHAAANGCFLYEVHSPPGLKQKTSTLSVLRAGSSPQRLAAAAVVVAKLSFGRSVAQMRDLLPRLGLQLLELRHLNAQDTILCRSPRVPVLRGVQFVRVGGGVGDVELEP
eukprot:CAMPEP_0195630576 /NCGR_PEP_ID=MMETSP0815-20121206/20621_1 /TAXON_ID=97485 /ORGANISM="Prymnesium parvum, Strain Texoma1" /LENGTH=114 /DNA_ID=CAMNT_0040772051 /DNA_START=233 /DNA_END=576 /DNA_ORIENTATION=-